MAEYPDLILDARRECAHINRQDPPQQCTCAKVLQRMMDPALYKDKYAAFGAGRKAPNKALLRLMEKAGFAVGRPDQMSVKTMTAPALQYQRSYLRETLKTRKGGIESVDTDIETMRSHTFHGGNKRKRVGGAGGRCSVESVFRQPRGWYQGKGFTGTGLDGTGNTVCSGDESYGNANQVVGHTMYDKAGGE